MESNKGFFRGSHEIQKRVCKRLPTHPGIPVGLGWRHNSHVAVCVFSCFDGGSSPKKASGNDFYSNILKKVRPWSSTDFRWQTYSSWSPCFYKSLVTPDVDNNFKQPPVVKSLMFCFFIVVHFSSAFVRQISPQLGQTVQAEWFSPLICVGFTSLQTCKNPGAYYWEGGQPKIRVTNVWRQLSLRFLLVKVKSLSIQTPPWNRIDGLNPIP